MPTLPIPTNANADFYDEGRLVAMRGTRPATVDPPQGYARVVGQRRDQRLGGRASRPAPGAEPQWTGGGAQPWGGGPLQGQGRWRRCRPSGPCSAGPRVRKNYGSPSGRVEHPRNHLRGSLAASAGGSSPPQSGFSSETGATSSSQGIRCQSGTNGAMALAMQGKPGRWVEAAGDHSPMQYGLDGDKGVVAFNGTSAHPVPSYNGTAAVLARNWRMRVYR